MRQFAPFMADETLQAASRFWDREGAAPQHVSWMAHPLVRDYINESIAGGAPGLWPADWFQRFLNGRRFERALSIGCGTGPLERDLLKRNIVGHFDAFDGSPQSLDVARRMAAEEGYAERVNYWLGDFNIPSFPRQRYDIVFFHQSAHHVSKLEKLYGAILRVLAPKGLLFLDEYIGPSRFEWDDLLLAPHRSFYDRIPAEARLFDVLPLPIHDEDPSEAIRSSEIVPQLEHGFRVLERRDYGGNLLSVLFTAIRWSEAPEGLVPEMLAAEKQLRASGDPSYHAVIVATPKSPRFVARIRYFLAPKLRRLRYDVLKWLRPQSNPKY